LDKQRALIEQQQNLDSQQSRVHELQAQIAKQESDIQSAEASFKKEQLDSMNDSQQRTSMADNDKDRTQVQKSQTELRAPVSGVVQKLNLSTIGGVVTNAQEVMEIVPDDNLEVALNISNKDIGFVHPGQDVIIKIETFPYTKYGYITGKLKKVANTATQKDKSEPYFEARASIPSNQFKVDGKWITLTPGMLVSAEIKTGERKVWQYFLSPLIQTGQQSLNAR
jgi:hemolysin D